MKIGRCNVCHSDLHLDAIIEDAAMREVLKLISQLSHNCAKPLVNYVALFRPQKSNLSSSRTLKLMQEVLELYKPSRHLCHALHETVKQIRERRAAGQYNALTNHNYLTKVYDTSKSLFLYTEASTAPAAPASSSAKDDYFRHMQSLGQDVTKLHGGKEWLDAQSKRSN